MAATTRRPRCLDQELVVALAEVVAGAGYSVPFRIIEVVVPSALA
jgi:hypothetical protein